MLKKQLDIVDPNYNTKQFNWETYDNYRLLSSTFSKLVLYNKDADETSFGYKIYLDHSPFNEDFKLFMDKLKNKNITKYNSYIEFVYYNDNTDVECENRHSYDDRYYDDDCGLYPTPDGMGTDDWDDYLEQNNID
jgi:hypothetical protein